MYYSGDIYDFRLRLHQLPTGTQELITGYLPEGLNYTGINQTYINNKWNREFNLKMYQYEGGGTDTGRWFI